MENRKIMLRYGELTLKGKNKINFIKRLESNMQKMKLFPKVKYDHMLLEFSEENLKKIKYIFGLNSYSIIFITKTDIEDISKNIIAYLKNKYLNKTLSFKIEAKRKDKSFEIKSDEIKRYIAKNILENTNLYVKVKNFDIKIDIKIDKYYSYFFEGKEPLLKGLPVGISGKAIHLISGGFDSPVAAFLMMKRGFEVIFVNFITPPHTDELTIQKTKNILKVLNKYQFKINLYLIRYTDLMNYLGLVSNQSYKITLMRRSFYRIASKIAQNEKSVIISNGENIGQVASQTAESINVISNASFFPVIRPLATYEKNEIIGMAKKIETHDISIINSYETCELFSPKSPIIKPNIATAHLLEKELNQINFFEDEILLKNTKNIFFNYDK